MVRRLLLEALGYELTILSSRDRDMILLLFRKTLIVVVEGIVLIRASQSGD